MDNWEKPFDFSNQSQDQNNIMIVDDYKSRNLSNYNLP